MSVVLEDEMILWNNVSRSFLLLLLCVSGKEVVLLMQALNSLATPEEKLAALCKKYADLVRWIWIIGIAPSDTHAGCSHTPHVNLTQITDSRDREILEFAVAFFPFLPS